MRESDPLVGVLRVVRRSVAPPPPPAVVYEEFEYVPPFPSPPPLKPPEFTPNGRAAFVFSIPFEPTNM